MLYAPTSPGLPAAHRFRPTRPLEDPLPEAARPLRRALEPVRGRHDRGLACGGLAQAGGAGPVGGEAEERLHGVSELQRDQRGLGGLWGGGTCHGPCHCRGICHGPGQGRA